jgi:hypothetical protein
MKTIKYVVLVEDKARGPQWVWGTTKDSQWGDATKGTWYNGVRLVAFIDEEDRDRAIKTARLLSGRVEKWEYKAGCRTKIRVEKLRYDSKRND